MQTIEEIKQDVAKQKYKFKNWEELIFCMENSEDDGYVHKILLKAYEEVCRILYEQSQVVQGCSPITEGKAEKK